jgi:hypothetical protein
VDYEGLNYCVPAEGAANTKRILGLLVQLIALNTSVEDIAITPNVHYPIKTYPLTSGQANDDGVMKRGGIY